MNPLARIRALTGVTVDQIDDDTLTTYLDFNDGQPECAAADVADHMATRLLTDLDITAVEDISVDGRRPLAAWHALADRLRARCAAAADDDGPAVIDFHPNGLRAPEGAERG